jgi:hypothetical protein
VTHACMLRCREVVRVLVRERAAPVPDGRSADQRVPVVQVRGERHGQVVAAAPGDQALHRPRSSHGQRRALVAPAPRRRPGVHARQAQGESSAPPPFAFFLSHFPRFFLLDWTCWPLTSPGVSQGRVCHMVECTKQTIRELREAASVPSPGGGRRREVEIGGYMARLTGDIISHTEFDTSYDTGKLIFRLLEDLQRLTASSSRHLWIPGSQ